MAKSQWDDQTAGGARPEGPAVDAKAVTPSNSADLPDGAARALYVGGAGDISVDTVLGTTVTLVGVAVGILPLMVKRVRSTGTTATNIVALY